jgi:hypothetical protein
MIGTRTLAAGLALLAGFALAPAARAGDTFRLDMPASGSTITLGSPEDPSADLVATAHRGGFRGGFSGGHHGFHGGHHGFHGGHHGFHGGFNRGFYGGHRGFYGGFNRGFYGGFYRPYFYGGYYRPYYAGFGYGYGSYYSYPGAYYGYPSYYSPCGQPAVVSSAPTMTLQVGPGVAPAPSTINPIPQMPPASNPYEGDTLPAPKPVPGTFPYDGGPKTPVPMPRTEEAPEPALNNGSTIRPADERFVFLPEPTISAKTAGQPATGKWAYPAYGEAPRRTSFAEDRPIKIGR